jgi:hypothetical protein
MHIARFKTAGKHKKKTYNKNIFLDFAGLRTKIANIVWKIAPGEDIKAASTISITRKYFGPVKIYRSKNAGNRSTLMTVHENR